MGARCQDHSRHCSTRGCEALRAKPAVGPSFFHSVVPPVAQLCRTAGGADTVSADVTHLHLHRPLCARRQVARCVRPLSSCDSGGPQGKVRTEGNTPNRCLLLCALLRWSRWVICVTDASPNAKYFLRRNQTVRIQVACARFGRRLVCTRLPTLHRRRSSPSVSTRSNERTSASRGSAH